MNKSIDNYVDKTISLNIDEF